nr:MAG TPA: hypothetical protein [Caudoviricetes sp.]
MSKRKKNSKQERTLATILLLTAIANLIEVLIEIIRELV